MKVQIIRKNGEYVSTYSGIVTIEENGNEFKITKKFTQKELELYLNTKVANDFLVYHSYNFDKSEYSLNII